MSDITNHIEGEDHTRTKTKRHDVHRNVLSRRSFFFFLGCSIRLVVLLESERLLKLMKFHCQVIRSLEDIYMVERSITCIRARRTKSSLTLQAGPISTN